MTEAARTETFSEAIAEFAAGFDPAMLKPGQVRQCARALIDTIAVAIAGRGDPAALRATDYALPVIANLTPGSAELWGRGWFAAIEAATLHNGVAAHVLDYDDVSSPMSGHPSVALLPALIALGQARDLPGRRLASAYVVGFEVACRLGRAFGANHYDRGWHTTATVGTVAATAACAHLIGLDAAAIVNAIGIAAAQTGGTRENFGTDAKSFQAGQCGAAAVRATLLADTGFTGASRAVDGKAGLFALYGAESFEVIASERNCFGALPLEIDRTGIEIKKYPACYATHRPVDALLELQREHSFEIEDIARLDVVTSGSGLAPLLKGRPSTGTQGKFSLPYVLATALLDGSVRLSSFTDGAVARAAAHALFEKVHARESEDPMLPRWASLDVTLVDGRHMHRRIDALRGAPENPLSDQELQQKVADCLAWGGCDIDPATFVAAAFQLDEQPVRRVIDRMLAETRTN